MVVGPCGNVGFLGSRGDGFGECLSGVWEKLIGCPALWKCRVAVVGSMRVRTLAKRPHRIFAQVCSSGGVAIGERLNGVWEKQSSLVVEPCDQIALFRPISLPASRLAIFKRTGVSRVSLQRPRLMVSSMTTASQVVP